VEQEGLRQILGVVGWMAEEPQIGVKRLPVSAAQDFQCGCSMLGIALACRQDHAPMGGREPSGFPCVAPLPSRRFIHRLFTDLLFRAMPIIGTVRVRENWSWVSLMMAE
jgi:hypothetical protein